VKLGIDSSASLAKTGLRCSIWTTARSSRRSRPLLRDPVHRRAEAENLKSVRRRAEELGIEVEIDALDLSDSKMFDAKRAPRREQGLLT